MWAWRILGGFFFALGAAGLVLPVWPTTIFWILAAACFLRSDPHWAEWIYSRPKVGPPIQLFMETGMLTRSAKTAAMIGMAIALVPIILVGHSHLWVLIAGVGLILAGSAYVLSRKSP